MSLNNKVKTLLDSFLESRTDLYLVDLKISPSNDIKVIIDGDQSVTLQDCLDASRAIENNLDREEEDFSLQVMSPGLTEPLKLKRQYNKNIDRKIKVELNDATEIEGKLISVDEDSITLLLKYRKKKDIGKGKVTVEEERKIPFSDIKKTLVKIKF